MVRRLVIIVLVLIAATTFVLMAIIPRLGAFDAIDANHAPPTEAAPPRRVAVLERPSSSVARPNENPDAASPLQVAQVIVEKSAVDASADAPTDPQVNSERSVGNAPTLPMQVTDARRAVLARAAERMTAPGLCEEKKPAREALIASFRRVDLTIAVLLIDPILPDGVEHRTTAAVTSAVTRTGELLLPEANVTPPTIIVYRSLNSMRSVACVNSSTYGYYDGAIHVSGNPNGGLVQLEETVFHEFVHHVLLQQGVRLPMWLSEGLAITIAGETWWKDPTLNLREWIRGTHLPFDELVPAFVHATDEKTATVMYFQSMVMVRAVLDRGGWQRVRAGLTSLREGMEVDDAFTQMLGVAPAQTEATFVAWVATAQL